MKKPTWSKKRKNRSPFAKKITRQGKLLLMAIGMAMFIGIILGVISLQMTKQDVIETYDKTTSVKKEHPETETTSTEQSLESIAFFVVQGGVFSDEENANTQAAQFKNQGYPAFNWKKNDKVYVFTGIASAEAEAKGLAKEMQEDGLEVYVKQQEIGSVQTQISEMEYEWLQQFMDLWQESISSNSSSEAPSEGWDKLMNQKITEASEVKVINQIQEVWQENKDLNTSSLLKLIYTYEKAF